MNLVPPGLIEPIKITVEQIDKSNTQFSDGLSGRRDAMNHVVRNTVTFQAQVVFGNNDQETEFSQMGATEDREGYLVVSMPELQNKGIDLKRGDKIVKMGEGQNQEDVELFITHSGNKPGAQFSSFRGFTLSRVFFADRKPEEG